MKRIHLHKANTAAKVTFRGSIGRYLHIYKIGHNILGMAGQLRILVELNGDREGGCGI